MTRRRDVSEFARRGALPRRAFLRGAGGVLLAAPFLTSLSRRSARAQQLLPRRSVIFYTHNGCITNRWFPSVEDGSLQGALSGTSLEVLDPWVNKLLIPRGLRSLNTYAGAQAIDPHSQATGSKLTCAPIDERTQLATSHSLDHELARQVNPAGQAPLVLSVGPKKETVSDRLSFSAPGEAFEPEHKPQAVYDQLLGANSGAAAYLRARQMSILDAVRDDLSTYSAANLAQVDKDRIESWAEILRETELSLGAAAMGCAQGVDGVTPEAVAAASVDTSSDAFTLGTDMMFKLMALSLLCDANRSLVFTFPGYFVFDWDGIHHELDTGALAHRTGNPEASGPCVADVLRMLTEIDGWYAAKFARLVGLLDAIAEGDGTVLDNTATIWLPEFADGKAHNLNNLPIVIAGSAGGYLKQGVAVNLEGLTLGAGNSEAACADGAEGVSTADTGSTTGNVPINKLYVTLMNALGCLAADGGPVTSFGTFDGSDISEGILDPGELTLLKL